MDRFYIEQLCEIYSDFFFSYEDAPLLVVKTDNVDFSREGDKLSYIIQKISDKQDGAEYVSFDNIMTDG